jgi:hypothetical protein
LHLIQIKELYSQIINRFYLVDPKLNYLKQPDLDLETDIKTLSTQITLKNKKRKYLRKNK